jgi:hypothetical protein
VIGKCYACPSATKTNTLKEWNSVNEKGSSEDANIRKQMTNQGKDQATGLTDIISVVSYYSQLHP